MTRPDPARGSTTAGEILTQTAAALRGQPNTAATLAEGTASVALVTAIYHAARQGQTVRLPIGPSHPLFGGWLPA